MSLLIGDTPAQLGSCLTADAMMIDGKIVTRDDYRALVAQVEALKSAYKKLSGAINDMDDAEIDTEEMDRLTLKVFKVMKAGYQIANEPEQHHLCQVRAEAVESALDAVGVPCTEFKNQSADFTAGFNFCGAQVQLHAYSIRQGGAE